MLEIEDLSAEVEGKPILKKLNLSIKAGEIHAVMGPNGAGKSTLGKVLCGHPSYEVTGGRILFMGQNIVEMEPEERAQLGLFMSFQYPPEISGLSTQKMLFEALQEKLSEEAFERLFDEKMDLVGIPRSFKERDVNEGFSGGEKKKNEILQMAVLQPKLAILDETDSGLDIDAMRVVAEGVNKVMSPKRALLVITHYQRLLDYIQPHFVHVLIDGKIVCTRDHTFALELEEKGYDWLT